LLRKSSTLSLLVESDDENRVLVNTGFAILDDVFPSSHITGQSLLTGVGNPTLLCLLGSRMFFNLKEAGEAAVNEGTIASLRTDHPTFSDVYFDETNNEADQ
jgi:hypothetical protein